MDEKGNEVSFLFYTGNEGDTNIAVVLEGENIWVTQKNMAGIFGTSRENITMHLKNIFESKELDANSVSKEILHTADDGKKYKTRFYNLDSIISVGYRINTQKATQFRIWATTVLKNYLIKGFVLDNDRLKQGKTLFGKDYFDELIEQIREIRASERRFYQKITDIYATAIDYNPKSKISHAFFATVQNKLEYAITHHTASEIIKLRSNSNLPNMGLTSWKNEKKGGKILKSDVSIAKNYLKHDEISELNILVNMILDYAELQAKRNVGMNMEDWVGKLDAFIKFNDYDVLKGKGKISAKVAKAFAEKEYSKFRIVQDLEFKSDFDKLVEKTKKGEIPPPPIIPEPPKEESLSDFNKKLKKGLDWNPKEKKVSAYSLKSIEKIKKNKKGDKGHG